MPIQTLETIKNWFRTGLKPTQAQFWDTWDSFRHKEEKVPLKEIEGIEDLLEDLESGSQTLDQVLEKGNISEKSANIGGLWINPTPGNNVLIGTANTGQGLPHSNYNTVVGIGAGAYASENYYSSMFGTYAGQSSSGTSNTFLGSFSGLNNTGSGTVAIGVNAGRSNTNNNVVVLSGLKYGDGGILSPSNDHQFIIGSVADMPIRFNTNVETPLDFDFPSKSGTFATTDDINMPVSAIQAGVVDNTNLQELGGTDKTINGIRIGKGNTNYENNLVIGRNGLASVTTGQYNVAIGNGDGDVEGPLQYLTTGNNNTMVGSDAGVGNITGGNNTGIGAAALFTNSTGSNNTALGAFALHNNTTGTYNDAFGRSALSKNTTAVANTAVGSYSLKENVTSPYNVAIGCNVLSKMVSGLGQSTAIGAYCMADATGTDKNAAIGTYALRYNTAGFSNTAIGHTALGLNTSGNSNNAFGNYSLGAVTTGAANIGIGKFAGRHVTTGIGNIYIGSEGDAADAEASGIVNIGYRFIAKGSKVSLIGTLNIETTPVYENNTTALAAGLTGGDVYRTSTGVLMIVY